MNTEKQKKSILEKATKASSETVIVELINEISKWLTTYPEDIELWHARALLFEKQQKWAEAINDYMKIQGIDKDDQRARTRVEMLKTILRYKNTDIYSSPNTHYDPWFE